ncbi:cytochrome C [Citreicella sp. C3M06]|uniref:c-type cytochrome n=1 Tax=Citreicella sp. C3M06 TaxID=2841564 RepID=UPI001C08C2A7|nr:cytochrome C [Citreicella sp. C3M06]MBU2960680.1 cytochrome C [Citreicella sp. C3M06]
MSFKIATACAAVMLAGSMAQAQDAEAGEQIFKKSCRSCHSIVAPDGEMIFKGGRTGPNLYGVIGRAAGTDPDFPRYKASLVEAGEKGLVWDEASFEEYVVDPSGFLKEYLGDDGARSGMSFKLRTGAMDLYAYLNSVSPE